MNFIPLPLPRIPAVRPAAVALLMMTLGLGGCASPDREPLRVPVTSQHYEWFPTEPKHDKTLLVFLPGRGTTGADFARQGFISALDHTNPNDPDRSPCFYGSTPGVPVDAVTVDLTFSYYTARIATRRLHEDIILPARRQGYRRIWLVGCSIGGFGAITYAHEYPGEISGIVALAPYLGDKQVVAEIEAGGGLARWQPRQPLANDDFQRRLWLAIKAERFGQPGRMPLVLGYGSGDRFAYGHRLLAAQLPAARVFQVFGFHNWITWHQLWRTILQSPVSPLAGQMPVLATGHS